MRGQGTVWARTPFCRPSQLAGTPAARRIVSSTDGHVERAGSSRCPLSSLVLAGRGGRVTARSGSPHSGDAESGECGIWRGYKALLRAET